jgi:hypothetical protein
VEGAIAVSGMLKAKRIASTATGGRMPRRRRLGYRPSRQRLRCIRRRACQANRCNPRPASIPGRQRHRCTTWRRHGRKRLPPLQQ